MPTLFLVGRYRIVVYPNDHGPPHIHVVGHGHARFVIGDAPDDVALSERDGISARDLRRSAATIIGAASTLRSVQVDGTGYGLHWPELDLDVSIPDLIAGCFGSRAWMSVIARHGGKARSAAKAAAARENGKKGGRPPPRPVDLIT